MPLEALYQRRPRVAQASEDVSAAEASAAAVRRQVAIDAATAFFRVALAQAAVAAAEEQRANLGQLVAFNEARVREGAAPEGDLIRVRVEMDRAATDLVLAEVELTRARGALWLFVDTAAGPALSPETLRVRSPVAGDLAASPVTLAALLTTARTSRPEVVSARAHVASAAAGAEYERRLNIRQLGGTFGIKSTAGQRSMIAGVSVTVPLFDRNQGAIQRATAERLAAEQELAWATRTVDAEVQTSFAAAERLRARAAEVRSGRGGTRRVRPCRGPRGVSRRGHHRAPGDRRVPRARRGAAVVRAPVAGRTREPVRHVDRLGKRPGVNPNRWGRVAMSASRVLAVSLAAALAAGCGRQSEKTVPPQPAPAAPGPIKSVTFTAEQIGHAGIRWAAAEAATMAAQVDVPGRVVADEDRTARVSAPAEGRVISVAVQTGDRVARGQVLVTLFSPQASGLRAEQAKGAAEIASREAALSYARSARERAERLLEAKAAARQDVERARADEQLAASALAQARAEAERAGAAATQLGVDAAGRMILRAPIAGVVIGREAVPGSVVQAGAPLGHHHRSLLALARSGGAGGGRGHAASPSGAALHDRDLPGRPL